MKISMYLRQNRGEGVRLAAEMGICPSYLSQMVTGHRPFSIERCVEIERATEGAVRRWDLRPDDWGAIWPELVGSPGAPQWPPETASDVSTDVSTEAPVAAST